MSDHIIALVIWYAREGLGRHVQVLCSEAIRRKRGDVALQLWRAYGLCLEGSYSEALRELQALSNNQEVALPRILLQIHSHKQARVVDEETLQDLEFYLPNEEKVATERSLYFSAVFCWLMGETDRARDYCSSILRVQPKYHRATALLGWMCGESSDGAGRADLSQESMPYFEKALSQGTDDVLAFLGKALCFDISGDTRTAIQSLTELGLRFPWFFPALSEKIQLLIKVEDWEQASEDARKLVQQDSKNLDGHLFDVFHLLAREGRTSMGLQRLEELCTVIESVEPRNPKLLCRISSLIARLSAGSSAILGITKDLMKSACKLAPDSSEALIEQGYQLQLLGQYQEAIDLYTLAGQLDDMNPKCLYASLQCQILLGRITEAKSQLKFLKAMTSENESNEIHLCEALLINATTKDLGAMLSLVSDAFDMQVKRVARGRTGYDAVRELCPPLLLQMAQILLHHCTSYPDPYMNSTQKNSIEQCNVILEMLVRYAPGLAYTQLLQAKCNFLLGKTDAAKMQITKVLRLNPTDSEAHVLLGQMHIHAENFDLAHQELQQAVSHSFQIRDNMQYKFANARIQAYDGRCEEATKILLELMSFQGSNKDVKTGFKFGLLSSEINRSDLALMFLQLVDMHSKLGKSDEARKVMKDALEEFRGTHEEMKIILAECNLLLESGNVKKALEKLETVDRDSPYFATSRSATADIYLKKLGNKEKYARCYMEIADKEPSVKNLITLGEAFMQIQDPARAISAYENALRMNPRDGELPSKIGKALISTHDFHKAVEYYERSVRNDPSNLLLQYELAELYFKLRKYDAVQNLCKKILKAGSKEGNYESIKIKANLHILLHSMYKEIGDATASIESLILAKESQESLIQHAKTERPESLYTESQKACKICHMIGVDYRGNRMHYKAMEYFEQAKKYEEGNIAVMLDLAKTHLACGNADACQQYCSQVLRLDHNHEQATMMLAELLFQKEDCETAIFHFQQILGKKPCHYQALCQMIHLLRRTGKLKEVQTYIDAAEKENVPGKLDAALYFCKGLQMKYMKKPSKSLSMLNLARKDRTYGTEAILTMIEIYLNPKEGGLWDETPVNEDDIEAATTLMQEIQNHSSVEKDVLEAYILMASKSKSGIEKALQRLVGMTNSSQDNVPVLLAMATAFSLLKQTPKARNQLKRISKMNYSVDDAEAFEQAWLLLIEIYIQGGKYDLAQDLAKKCIKYNKSCGKAWEYIGIIMEKEQAYKDAADKYLRAWKLGSNSDPQLGFRLAFNYLKAKRHVEAIDVCHKILEQSPDFPKIRAEILEKAQASLRA
ncbi:tetratricopeptide repeat domain-containing protein [Chloropicon primus]|uniref:Tetratricopeptide repeat domain-containing protein n=1 Tax=Chloropicon primus TaxID=1764295 RepID=A0A5B8MF55_9CHLO|nr:tetratricopeptide repeat domain-containing protein [Chloropicon primus]UPQ98302.1 tetratricopeptide repeat domain-containing protein [Chloropicon primus]|eukprot:QDZ19093.1 tetratricopeptide repeat domain-containing protein [Chloropicon primus]